MYLVDAKLNLGSNPVVFEGAGEVICLLAIMVFFDLGFDGTKFHFGFALQYDPSIIQQFKFSDVLPKFTSIDGLDLVAPALAIATAGVADVGFWRTGLGRGGIRLALGARRADRLFVEADRLEQLLPPTEFHRRAATRRARALRAELLGAA